MTVSVTLARGYHRVFPFSQLRTARWILKNNRDEELNSIQLFGYDVHLRARSTVHVLLSIQGEKWVEDTVLLAPHVRQGMTVMDVGANIGYLTLFFCRAVGAQGAVFAFEPEPDNFSDLARAVENNQISCCKTINYACGAYDKEASLASGLNGYIQMEGLGARKCQMVALDSFVIQQNIPKVDVVKIDVEGFESDVLRGMEQIIQRDHPVVYVEVHPPGFCGNGDPRRVCSFLKEHYKKLVAFRIWSDVKQGLPFWQRVRASYRSDYPVQHFCETTLDEVMNTKENRYQVLALPEPDEDCSRT